MDVRRGSEWYARRGAALLLVLAMLVLVATACVSIADLVSTERLRQDTEADRGTAFDLMRAAERPIASWLAEASPGIVLPPDSERPEVAVLFDAWSAGSGSGHPKGHSIRISAWDQCGMAPHRIAGSASPLRSAVAPSVLRRIDGVDLDRARAPGLDLFATPRGGEGRVSAFPVARLAERAVLCLSGAASGAPDVDREAGVAARTPRVSQRAPSVGASIGTHNPGVVNVNTSPMELVEAAFRAAGRSGAELVAERRAAGDRAVAPEFAVSEGAHRGTPRLVDESTAWAFRIDVRVGSIGRSWWAIYERADSERNTWKCVQRLAIPR